MSFIWPILRGLCEEAGLKSRLERRRAQFLEDEIAQAIGVAIPDAAERLADLVEQTAQPAGR